MDFIPPFGDWLRACRLQLGMTQADLARRVGCAAITIRKLEAGERQPSRLVAERLAERLEVPDARHAAFVAFALGEATRRDTPAHGHVPVTPTPLVGRAAERALARRLLRRPGVRLLTLVGPPGVGKTRLAQQVAADANRHFPDGAWFVALAPLTDPDSVIPTIAIAIGAGPAAGQTPSEGLTRYLRDRHLLLVLDNFEQVSAAAPQVARLLAAAPGLQVLVTSREPLHISGEHELPVAPLALPAGRGEPSVAELAHCPSVRLFVQRARAVKPAFRLDAANAPAVAQVCRRLDGLPLAIELAAIHVKMMTPQALLAELAPHGRRPGAPGGGGHSPFPLLAGGPRDLPRHQRTLWDTIDWSYNLLSTPEQRVFRRLGAFVGGCTLEAAEAVCDDGGPTAALLQSLTDRSLLQQADGLDGVPRYVLLELVREYAAARLEASGESGAVQRRHAEYFAQWTVPAGTPLMHLLSGDVRGDVRWARRLDAEYGNLHAALAWCQADDAPATELALAANMAAFLGFPMPMGKWPSTSEAHTLLEHTLERSRTAPPGLRARLLHGLTVLALSDSRFEQATALGEESTALYRQAGDRAGEAAVLRELGRVAYTRNDLAYGQRALGAALGLWQELGEEHEAAVTRFWIADVVLDQGHLDEAAAIYEDVLSACRRLGAVHRPLGVAPASLMMLGLIAQLEGNPERAAGLEEEGLRLGRDAYAGGQMVWALAYLGRAALQLGQLDRAAASIRESLTLCHDAGVHSGLLQEIAVGLDELAAVRWAQGRTREAVTLAASAEPMRSALGAVTPVSGLAADHARMLERIRPRLDDPHLATAWAAGVAKTAEQAVEYALQEDEVDEPLDQQGSERQHQP
jgi:predicted ATPase/DNA-binding XRE family transcriptional regulator